MRTVFAAVVLLGMVLLTNRAEAVTLNFDSMASGTYTEAQFNSYFTGVSFNNTGGSNFQLHHSSSLQPDFTLPAVVINNPFDTSGNSTVAAFSNLTNFVSVTMGDYNSDRDSLYLYAYDASNNLLGSDYYDNPSNSYAGRTLSVSLASPLISYVKFYGAGVSYNSVYWDNFTFNEGKTEPVIPEPTTLSILGLGLLGLAGLRKRK